MKKTVFLILTLLPVLSFGATSPKDAHNLVKANKAVMIDVREADEIKSGMIDKAIWFPMSKILNDKNWQNEFVKVARDKKIFLYCRSGNRSGKVMAILKEKGMASENIGGFETLKNELPTQRPLRP